MTSYLKEWIKRDLEREGYERYTADMLVNIFKCKQPKAKIEYYSKILEKMRKPQAKQDNRTSKQIIDDTLKLFKEVGEE